MRKAAAKEVEPIVRRERKSKRKPKRIRAPRGQRRPKRGQPPHEPTKAGRDLASLLAGFGIPHREIARAVGVGIMTLRSHYADELVNGKTVVERKLVNNLFRLSQGKTSVALRATMFMLMSKFHWSKMDLTPPKEVAASNKPDEPVDADGNKLGKKEKANLLAQVAHKETSWDKLVGSNEAAN